MGNLPIGQGLSVTPMQMAAAYSAIADGGILRPPQLVLEQGGRARSEPPRPARDQRADRGAAAADARGRAGAGRHRLRGQRPRLHARRQDRDRRRWRSTAATRRRSSSPRSSASRPPQDPRLLVAVVVNEPQGGNYYGGTVAAPAFGEIAKFALPYLEIPPDQPTEPRSEPAP